MIEIHTSLDEITDTLQKLKDADPAGFHYQDILKQDIVAVTIETNLRQGELQTEVDGTLRSVTKTETERNEALSEWEEGLISDQNGAVVCLRKRKSDDVSTSVLSGEVDEIQASVGESSFSLQERVLMEFEQVGARAYG